MKLLAIDPGYDRVGIAILEKNPSLHNGRETVVFSTCVQTDKTLDFYGRMKQVTKALEYIIAEYQPTVLVIEELYFAKNTQTAMRVSEARGIIAGVCMNHDIRVHEIHPNRVKIAITGHGSSNKADILWMLPKLVTIDTDKKLDDELDAIAMGVAFFAEYKMNQV